MLNLTEINNTIEELEHGNTTYDSCIKLAALYTVRDKLNTDTVIEEYHDILPQYQHYVSVKRKYQLGELTDKAIIHSIDSVCQELFEFIQTMYSCTDTDIERTAIKAMINRLNALVEG